MDDLIIRSMVQGLAIGGYWYALRLLGRWIDGHSTRD